MYTANPYKAGSTSAGEGDGRECSARGQSERREQSASFVEVAPHGVEPTFVSFGKFNVFF